MHWVIRPRPRKLIQVAEEKPDIGKPPTRQAANRQTVELNAAGQK
jgi:hypothetical protein